MVKNNAHRNGQIMIEIIIALGVFSLLASALTTLVFSSSAGFWVGDTEAQAAALLRQSIEEIKQTKASAWNDISVGTTTVALSQSDIANMTKTITVSDVCRSGGVIVECPSGLVDVFSKQVTVSISFETRTGRTREMSSDVILTNWDSVDWNQTSWVGGSGADVFAGATQYAYDDSGVTVQGDGSVRLASAPAVCQGYTWDFETPSEYTFDTQTTQVQSGAVSVVVNSPFVETKTWDFNVASDYVFDVTQVQSQSGVLSVAGQSGFLETKTWDFNTPSEYVFSSGAQSVGGYAALKMVADDANTVALYHFDEASGTFIDASSRNNTLTTLGTPTYGQIGQFGTSVLFDTTGNDYARILDTAQSGLDGMSQLTIDGWVKLASRNTADVVVVRKWSSAAGRSYALTITPLGAVRFYTSSNGTVYKLLTTPNAVVALDTWTHIAAVYDGSFLRVFINGQSSGTPVAATGALLDGVDQFQISNTKSSALNGLIDELRISNIARWTSLFSVPTAPYGVLEQSLQTVTPVQGISLPAVEQWVGFVPTAVVGDGASVTYQLSSDGGVVWQYWNAVSWSTASALTMANTATEVSTHISSFTTSTGKLLYRAVLKANGIAQAQLDAVTISYRVPPIDQAVVGLWHFNESSGVISDSSGRNNHLSQLGTPTYGQAGKFASSILFDTTGNDYARILDTAQSGLDGMSQLTIDGWVKRATTQTGDVVVVRKYATATGRSYSLQITPTGVVRFYVSVDGATATLASSAAGVVPLNTWTHIAAVYDGATMRIFINGQLSGTPVARTGSVFNGVDLFQISATSASALNGYIDEVRISNVARWTSAFTPPTSPYGGTSIGVQVVTPKQSIRAIAIDRWTDFLVTSTVSSPGVLGFQLSDDDGVTWRYWDGNNWTVVATTSLYNSAAEVDDRITSFPTSSAKLTFRALLSTGGSGQATLDEVSIRYAVPSLDSAVVGLWHFDEASGNVVDSSGRNNTLTMLGTPTRGQTGVFASSTLFDTTGNDYARILDTAQSGLDGMSQLTIDGWVKRATIPTGDVVVVRKYASATGRSYSLQITSTGVVRFYVSVDGAATTLASSAVGVVPLNTWTHIAAVYDGAIMRIFINGQLSGTPVARTGSIFNGADLFQISNTSVSALNGLIDELRISNVARWATNFTPYSAAYGTIVGAGSTVASIMPNNSFSNQAVSQWYSFSESAQKNTGTITYQLSADNGASWQYWNGTDWVSATAQTQANDAQTVSNNIWKFPVGAKQIRFRAFLTKDAVLGSVSIDCSTLQMEAGDMTVSGSGTTEIVFANRYTRPVVVMSTYEGGVAVPVVQSVSSTGATLSLQTVSGRGVSDTAVRYMVVEEGVWNMEGMLMEAKRMNVSVVGGNGLSTTTFRQSFESTPVVFAQRMSRTDAGFAIGQVVGPTQTNAQIGLSSVGIVVSHPEESVGWIAVEPNRGATIGRSQVRTGSTGVGSACANISLFSAVDESPLTLSATQASINGWSTSCGESTTTTVALKLDGEAESAVSTGYLAFTRPFRYTEAVSQSSGYVGRGSLTSSAFPLGNHDAVQIFDMNSTLPTCSPACKTYGYVRVANDTAGAPTGWSDWYGPVTSTEPSLIPNTLNGAAWVQYRVDLFGDGVQTPVLRATSINYK
jgi:type II secretory pathway pseudopilin PulG